MRLYILAIPLVLLLLTTGCVGEMEDPLSPGTMSGIWVHDSPAPVFIFSIHPDDRVDVIFTGLEDPGAPEEPVVGAGTLESRDEMRTITYLAPVSREIRILHLEKTDACLILKAASQEDGTLLDIGDLAGIRFVRGASYSMPLLDLYGVDPESILI
ncbi:MAG: hypothetical protein D5R99_00810 [Methanocalculus sp. MSAO_Arc1]|uniref:hypothetical protein n=1 Tax=Methanocalculus TaxID=71151 RepID=UPI000FF6ED9A|nr:MULTISPECIES: hypothetical protein [unclassified Methanocalculus]MCP1662567.1 hypothetical protein [Methanocalculus sp. AMF5]RQD81837.1 MAG: hypothetical protein D5R99_00810 [Methanocalculus sp. MSAO_Arc1]